MLTYFLKFGKFTLVQWPYIQLPLPPHQCMSIRKYNEHCLGGGEQGIMLCTKVYVLHLSMIASSWVISHHSPPQELDFMYLSKIYCIYLYFIHTIKKRYVYSIDEMLRHSLGDSADTLFELWSNPPPIMLLSYPTNPAYWPGCWSHLKHLK